MRPQHDDPLFISFPGVFGKCFIKANLAPNFVLEISLSLAVCLCVRVHLSVSVTVYFGEELEKYLWLRPLLCKISLTDVQT